MELKDCNYEGLELSTRFLIETAIARGIKVEILDEIENIIRLTQGVKVEILMQATRTSADHYIAPLVMTNKHVTKILLDEAGIRVPAGYRVSSIEEGLALFEQFNGEAMVVKPQSTNFGVGITMLPEEFSIEMYEKALRDAFAEDVLVLIESFAPGKEYRFLVIDGKVIGILHRVPANVEGDGEHDIEWLVGEKNKDPLRGYKYTKPLEKIKLGDFEKSYLKEQGKTTEYVPAVGEVVYLRKNSNISTGGDSIDFTDAMAEGYKHIAIASAEAVDAKVCGVDMVVQEIDRFDEKGYSIIELNFNPAIHIHIAPYKGENRHPDEAILDMLGFN